MVNSSARSSFERFRRCASRTTSELSANATEDDLRTKVVFPLLRDGLGIQSSDIHLEPVLGEAGRADMVVRMDGAPALVVECKRPTLPLREAEVTRRALEQAERYATKLPVDRVLVTNGTSWVLTSRRQVVASADSRSAFLKRLREFFSYLNLSSLWLSATGLILPEGDEEITALLYKADTLQIERSDLRLARNITASRLPDRGRRLEEEVRKSFAVAASAAALQGAFRCEPFSILHVDPTFVTPRKSAWSYDPFYKKHRQLESAYLHISDHSGVADAGVRALAFANDLGREERWRLADVAGRLVRGGFTVLLPKESQLVRLGIPFGDVIGNSIGSGFRDGEGFSGQWTSDKRRSRDLRDGVRELMSASPEIVVRSANKQLYDRLVETLGL